MKKHIFAIFTYFATFFISFFLVSLLTERPQTKATSCFPSRNAAKVFTNSEITEQDQEKTLSLLRNDYIYGAKYFRGSESAEETGKLVERMRSLDNSDLPLPVRKAYQSHTEAWSIYANHLRNAENHERSDRECKIFNRNINETYNTLLLAAKNYDVEFGH